MKQDAVVNMVNKKFLSSRRINLTQSTIQQVKMPYEMSMTGKALQQRMVDTNIQVGETRRALKSSPRSEAGGRADSVSGIMENIVVRNLLHIGQGRIFDGK